MRTIAVATVARSDYGIYTPVLRLAAARGDLRMPLIVGGNHLSEKFGRTFDEIKADGFEVAAAFDASPDSDSAVSAAAAAGRGLGEFAAALAALRPDMLMVLGDRYDMLPAAAAALPLNIPVAHLHGGEVTTGAIDDLVRHAISKLSHLHFVAHAEAAARVERMGEEKWRITISGAPGLDNLRKAETLSAGELERIFNLRLTPPPLLVTFHPATMSPGEAEWQAEQLVGALEESRLPVVATMPNADCGHDAVIAGLRAYHERHPQDTWLVSSLGSKAYFSLMRHAAAMVGNSSSGIIEAPSLELPVVNIGDRQGGRLRAANVLDCGNSGREIRAAIVQAVSPEFRQSLRGLRNPYGDGDAAAKIVGRLVEVPLDRRLVNKLFVDA